MLREAEGVSALFPRLCTCLPCLVIGLTPDQTQHVQKSNGEVFGTFASCLHPQAASPYLNLERRPGSAALIDGSGLTAPCGGGRCLHLDAMGSGLDSSSPPSGSCCELERGH